MQAVGGAIDEKGGGNPPVDSESHWL